MSSSSSSTGSSSEAHYSPFLPIPPAPYALPFLSRRSPLICRSAAVSSSQPLASQIGLSILQRGGNAVDACVAVAAALNVLEPCSTGIGGDCFALFYDAKTRKVHGLNGSGAAPAKLSLDTLPNVLKGPHGEWTNLESIHCVTVPGAAAGWADCVAAWGSGMSLLDILSPAIDLAENGAPITPITAAAWNISSKQLANSPYGGELLMDGKPPAAGALFKNPNLAKVFRLLGEKGKKGYYEGSVAEAIISVSKELGGHMDLEDLKNHQSEFVEPIKATYRGVDIYEIPPNGQGVTALLALNLLTAMGKHWQPNTVKHLSAEYYHAQIEALRLAFADTSFYVADPKFAKVPLEGLLSPSYAQARVKENFSPSHAKADPEKGRPESFSNTCSFIAVDGAGNACSFINSNYVSFGTGIVPKGCGFTLQSRGGNFVLDPKHPNALQGGKRPYHTIIPGLAVYHDNGDLFGPFSVMGAFMQPQGHVQVLVNLLDYGLDPQSALDVPRFCIDGKTISSSRIHSDVIFIEDSVDKEVIERLRQMGHNVKVLSGPQRMVFGRGQIIRKDRKTGVLWAGSDGRADGAAVGH